MLAVGGADKNATFLTQRSYSSKPVRLGLRKSVDPSQQGIEYSFSVFCVRA